MSDFPIFFTDDEKEWLKGSPFLNQINEKIEDIKIDYNLICKEVPEFAQFSLEEYSEVRMMVSSRIFGITINGVKTDGFVPYADMLNHKRPRQTTWFYSDERQGFIIEACDDIPRGSQVYDSYGRKCNSRFFLNYGFINMNNDANEVPIIVHLNKEDPGYEVKLKLINEKKDFMKFRVVDNLDEPVMHEFISWIRYAVFDGDLAHLYFAKNNAIIEAQKKRHQNKQDSEDSDDVDLQDVFKGTSMKFISIENEVLVWKKVIELCKASMSAYETTYEEDQRMIDEDDKEPKLTQNKKNCLLFRHGEKKILQFLITTGERILAIVDMPIKDARKTVNGYKDFEGCLDYVKNTIYAYLQNKK